MRGFFLGVQDLSRKSKINLGLLVNIALPVKIDVTPDMHRYIFVNKCYHSLTKHTGQVLEGVSPKA
ncbi:hypothetical protein PN36_10695 [Candidatus Thiomargarita nelsonii]|uniref:Uncharacterized protein n=1 Tax=Candidatus Thiomargarita nelsonii TaxID=1003181 RepID=A0A4E0QRD6_9GAMM|nr:hypothetical protein PN36_10695 [Candidatus Thiomargarita nelsonii]